MSTATGSVTYRAGNIEEAVKATIRQVTQPGVRQVMWDAWQAAIEAATADSSEAMPWEPARTQAATVITQESAHRAMVRMLEAVDDISLRHRIRDLLALEAEFIEAEGAEGIKRTCAYCGRPYRAKSSQSKFCSVSHRQAAHKKRKREAERARSQIDGQDQPGTA
jgi:hypothetical protein